MRIVYLKRKRAARSPLPPARRLESLNPILMPETTKGGKAEASPPSIGSPVQGEDNETRKNRRGKSPCPGASLNREDAPKGRAILSRGGGRGQRSRLDIGHDIAGEAKGSLRVD